MGNSKVNFQKTGIIIIGILLILGAVLMKEKENHSKPCLLNAQEREWLNAHRENIRLAHTPDWPPMDFEDRNGKHLGLVADYIHLIEKKLNFKFKIIRAKNWEEILSLARQHQIDVISAGEETQKRKKYMTWTNPYLNLKTTIIVKNTLKGALTLDRMQGMKIGVPREYAVGEFIRDKYPDLTIVDVSNSGEGMQKVSFGELDAIITEVPNALYFIENEKITNLRLAGETEFELTHGMGIRNDWPLFFQIMEKALASISVQEHRAIRARWIQFETTRFYQTKTFWYIVFGASSAVILVICFSFLWNRTLKTQVMQRTQALRFNEKGLEALLELNEQTHASISEILEFAFRHMLRLTRSRLGYLAFYDQDHLIYIVASNQDSPDAKVTTHNFTTALQSEKMGFWGEAVRQGKPVISNDNTPENPVMKGQTPECQNTKRYINVPIFSNGKVVVVAAMGNKETEYTSSDLKQLNLLAQGMWRLIQRKRAEQAILKSEKRFRDLVENLPNGIAIVLDYTIVYKNPKLIQILGDFELFSPSGYKQIHQDDSGKVKRLYRQMVQKKLKQSELVFRFYPTEDTDDPATMRWVNCITTPMDYQDKNAYLIIIKDMTEAKKLERLLTIQDKMASLGHVSAGIAHEIRNPLSGINIYIRTIEKNYNNPEKAQKIEKSIEAIRSASRKMESVIKRVMNFAKPMEPRFNRIDINNPIREAVKLTRFYLVKKGINMNLSLEKPLPFCYAESHLIEEVILNLINNAADAIMTKQGEGAIHISSTLVHESIIISVEDNGPGIPRDLRERIFEPFFTTKEYSTGIGLSLCHRIITDHNAKFMVIPSELGGAKFMIKMPVLPVASKENPPEPLNCKSS